MTASDHGVPERRESQRRRIVQPAFYGENRTVVRRTDDGCDGNASETACEPQASETASDVETSGSANATLPAATPQHDYDFLTGLISMEHSG